MRPVLTLPRGDKSGGVDAQVTVHASYRLQKKKRENVLLKKRAATGSVRCRTAAIRAVKTASQHKLIPSKSLARRRISEVALTKL
jgi:hypothetical protein